ncbi:MAG: cation-translocating P-type ATPase [Gammaproteobacteria bacterium]|nr:cation-translocating P-type ATPase [Gammaproteobacteria bacterium]
MNQAVATGNPLRVKIQGMDCGSCALTIESSIRKLPGVKAVSVSFTTETMEVTGDATLQQVEGRLRELGYRVASDERPAQAALPQLHGLGGFLRFLWSQHRLRMALILAIAALVGIPLLAAAPAVFGFAPLDLLFILVVVMAGLPVFLKGMRALLVARQVTIDLLMAVASVGALAIGEHGEAVTVILLYTLGEALEAYSAERARGSLRSLLALQPQEATVLREHRGGHDDTERHDHDHGHEHDTGRHDDHNHAEHQSEPGHGCAHDHDHDHEHGHEHKHEHGHDHADHGGCSHEKHGHEAARSATAEDHDEVHYHQVILPVEQVAVGESVLVRPGQRIPVDGEILQGSSSVNQAAVTGESIPVPRGPGDAVMAGTVNGEAALTIRVTRPAGDATIARIARLVEQAQAQRSPAERFIDRFARYYTPAVVLLAALVVALPVLAFGQPLLDGADGTHGWLYRGLALLIVACPCALVISIPVTVVSSLTRLAHLGVLVKGGAQLDRLADVRAVAFDKTGTLTHGRPQVTAVRAADCEHPQEAVDPCDSCDDVVALAASVERASEHPVAHAIVTAASERRLEHRYGTAQSVTAHAGRGVIGSLGNGVKVAVGSDALATARADGALSEHANGARDAGHTVMYVARDDKVVGFIGVQDAVREASREALRELRTAEPPVATVMLTGDNPQAAARVAATVGHIDDVRAGLLPEEKLAAIEKLHERYGAVAMVGDGINDAPALARADVGIAMGAGTAQAMETADVVLMQDDISHVPLALRIARRSRTLVKQNIALSLGLKLAFLALAVPGITTLWMAVLADVGATMLVTLNGMRVLREN